jgi:hypothetical protein
MGMEDRKQRPSIFWALILIAVGVFLLLNALNLLTLSGWDLIWRLWPVLFIVGGLDGLYRRDGFVGPLVAIGLGTVILLGNLGYLSTVSWTLLLRFWPVFLIALGLDLLIGRHSAVSAVIGVAVGLVLVAGIAWAAINLAGPRTDLRSQPMQVELGAAKRANVKIEAVAADVNLSKGANSPYLMEGDLQLSGNERPSSNYTLSGDRANYELKIDNNFYVSPFAPVSDENRWTLKFNPAVPLRMDTSVVFGRQSVDLTGLKVDNLSADTVFGQTVLNLAEQPAEQVEASVVFGELVVRVPRGTDLVIQADTAFTGASLPPGFVREDGRIYSPNADRGAPANVKASVPFGSLRVEEY